MSLLQRAIQQRLYSAKETYILKEPTNHRHPIAKCRQSGTESSDYFKKIVCVPEFCPWDLRPTLGGNIVSRKSHRNPGTPGSQMKDFVMISRFSATLSIFGGKTQGVGLQICMWGPTCSKVRAHKYIYMWA